MLRACRRALKPGGRIAYYNIFIADDLPADIRRRVGREASNRDVYTRARQRGLLESAGFARIEEHDVTGEYLRVQRALYEANARYERALRKVQGGAVFEERQSNRRRTLLAIEAGYLRRSLLVAERPKRRKGAARPTAG